MEPIDVIIIGKGPAGISASLYTVRANLTTVILGKSDSSLLKASLIENYYGLAEPVSGEELLKTGENQAKKLGAVIKDEEVISVENSDENFFTVKTAADEYKCRAVLLSTGKPPKKVNIEGLEKFEGRGISYCTTCDGFFFRNISVGVIGYNEYAIHEASELLTFTKDITVFTNGNELDVPADAADNLKNFKIRKEPIIRFNGDAKLEEIELSGEKIKINGIFIAFGSASSISFAQKLGIAIENGTIITDKNQSTNVNGIFAAGDCAGEFKQISTAVGQGAIAGKNIINYVKSKKK